MTTNGNILTNTKKRLCRFAASGLANTATGYAVIFIAMMLGTTPYLANAMGYGTGFFMSFFLQKLWVFQSSGRATSEIPRFVLSITLSYGANLLALHLLLNLGINAYFSQVLAGAIYMTLGFILSSRCVFKGN